MMTPTGTAPAGAKNVGRSGNQSLGTKDLDPGRRRCTDGAGGKERRPRTEQPSDPGAHLLSEELPP